MNSVGVNLYLVGFPGTGKSTVGRQVAKQLNFEFFDSDHEIERLLGKSVADIFTQDGELVFRDWERRYIDREHPVHGSVVACGGGLAIMDGMLEKLRSKGVVLCFHASLETIIDRTARGVHRPLMQSGDGREKRIRELYRRREEAYSRAGTMILTDYRPLLEITLHVLRVYRCEAAKWILQHL